MRINTRTQLIETAHRLSPSRACQRAIYEGRVEVLGGFKLIPPWNTPGWVIRVLSRHGRTWFLAVRPNDVLHSFVCSEIEDVPWDQWDGTAHSHGVYQPYYVYSGDDPHTYAQEYYNAAF